MQRLIAIAQDFVAQLTRRLHGHRKAPTYEFRPPLKRIEPRKLPPFRAEEQKEP